MYVITEYQYRQLRNRYPRDEVIRDEIRRQTLNPDNHHSEERQCFGCGEIKQTSFVGVKNELQIWLCDSCKKSKDRLLSRM